MQLRPFLSCLALLTVASQLEAQSPPPAMVYRIDEIPYAGTGDYLWPTAMNASQVVGGANETPGGESLAFLFENNTLTILGTIYNGDTSFAYGINAHGTIVGSSDTSPFGPWAFIKKDSYFGFLPLPAGLSNSAATAINDDGKIAGDALNTTGRRVLRWPKWTLVAPEQLGYLQRGHTIAYAHAINSLGWIAGSSGTPSTQTATLWKTTTALSIGAFATWTYSSAHGVNSDGWVTGEAHLPNGDVRAFLWKPLTGMAELPPLNGSNYARADGINDLGWVVGTSNGKATVWINGAAHDISNRIYNLQGWANLMQFTATNNQRGFVGLGVRNFQIRGFRLVPVSN